MNRHPLLLLTVVGALALFAALGAGQQSGLLLLDWAQKASAETPPVAVLIEMGLTDTAPKPWAGRASVTGAKVVHREGYRFREGDKLQEPDAWQASSHRPIRLPPRNPALARTEGIATVGVVLHLTDVQPEASLIFEPRDKEAAKAVVPLKEVLAGKPKMLWKGAAVVRLISTATPVVMAKTEDDFPAAAYGPDGTLWVAYISYTLRDESRRIEEQPLKEQPADFKAFFKPEFSDQLFVKSYRDSKWSEPIALTGPKEDLVRCAIGAESNGNVWVVYSANRKGRYDLFARQVNGKDGKPGAEQQLTKDGAANLSPVVTTGPQGLCVVYQLWKDRREAQPPNLSPARVGILSCNRGKWAPGLSVGRREALLLETGGTGNNWNPALVAGPNSKLALAFDCYEKGDYDVGVDLLDNSSMRQVRAAQSPRFEARPSIVYDPTGRLWVAYEEGPEKWGKDYGALDAEAGYPLYNVRSVRVVCLENGKLMKPVAELPTSVSKSHQPDEKTPRYAYPRLGIDGKGRVWLTYRQKFGTRYSSHPGSYWLTFARRLDGDRWSEPIEIHHSDGLLDSRPVVVPHRSGGLLIIHNTDGRYTTPETIDNQIYASVINLPGERVEPKLMPHEPGQKDGKEAAHEQEAVKRIRDYRVDAEGKQFRLLRGEFHRHTEISWDGGPDGSLEDMFRYAIDAAALDWIGNTDHDSGGGREYSWWLIQKFSDAYHVGDAFNPMFAYERSVSYPHGHRNCIFAKRGVLTLPRLAEPDPAKRVAGIHADDTKMLYGYLKELNGICASHTSATGMGTDWRDNDPQVEPVVEIYQGDRNNYEYPDAPRAGHDPESGIKPIAIGGWRPAGFINHAFEKGYRLGFQSSSDHWSTHISFCIALAEKPERESILAALKKRRCYAATDNIILDVRSGPHLMGEEFRTRTPPALQMTVTGVQPLAQIDIIKDSRVVHTIKPGQDGYKGTWTDPNPTIGTHYYYVRVRQVDDQLAWSSPMWIEYAK